MRIFSKYSLFLIFVLLLFLLPYKLFWGQTLLLMTVEHRELGIISEFIDYDDILVSLLIIIVGILFSILFKKYNSQYSLKSLTKPTFFVVLFFLILVNIETLYRNTPLRSLVDWVYNPKEEYLIDSLESSEDPKSTKCEGDESCLSKVEERFTSTGKMILSERYSGNGIFIVEFMDQEHNVTGSAKVSTDCNCEITNVNVSTHQ
jgi:hypothetical protein